MTGAPTALITGAAGTLGSAIAAGLSRAGHPVGLTDVDEAGLEAVRSVLPGPAITVAADATATGEAQRVVAEVGGLGTVGILVNAMGTFGPRSAFVDADEDVWWRVMEVNLRAPAAFLRAVLPAMAGAGRGHVVNLASRTAVWDDPAGPSSAYATSKAALVRLGQAVASEAAAPQVVIVSLSPGLVRSAMTAGRPDYASMTDAEFVPVDRTVAHVLALVSGAHDHLHGHLVHALDDLDELGARVAADPTRRRLGLGPVGAADPFG